MANDSSRSRINEEEQQSDEEKIWNYKVEQVKELFKQEMSERLNYLQYFFPSEDNEKDYIERMAKEDEEKQIAAMKQLLREKIAERRRTLMKEKVNSRLDKIEKHRQYLLDTNSLPIRQYLMDNILPHVTEALVRVTDKINFTELNDDNLDTYYPENCDPMDELIEFLEDRGRAWQEKITEEARKKMEERNAREEARKAAQQESEWNSDEESGAMSGIH